MSTQQIQSLARWVGAAAVAVLGLVVFLLFAPDARRDGVTGPSGRPLASSVAAVGAGAAARAASVERDASH